MIEEDQKTKELKAYVIDLGSGIQAGNLKTTVVARQLTKTFAAPEVLDENLKPDYKSDVWSLGCVLYFMVIAIKPWDKSTRSKPLKNVDSYIKDNQRLLRDSLPNFVL